MPITQFLHALTTTCPFCNQQGGILFREHPQCRRAYQAGWNEMVRLTEPPTTPTLPTQNPRMMT